MYSAPMLASTDTIYQGAFGKDCYSVKFLRRSSSSHSEWNSAEYGNLNTSQVGTKNVFKLSGWNAGNWDDSSYNIYSVDVVSNNAKSVVVKKLNDDGSLSSDSITAGNYKFCYAHYKYQLTCTNPGGYHFDGWSITEGAYTLHSGNLTTDETVVIKALTDDITITANYSNPWSSRTMQYKIGASGTWTNLTASSPSGMLRKYTSGSISQSSGGQLYLRYNGSTTIDSGFALVSSSGDEGANNFKLVDGRPTFKYSNVSGQLEIRVVGTEGSTATSFYCLAKGIQKTSGNYWFTFVKNGTDWITSTGVTDGWNYKTSSNVFLNVGDKITLLNNGSNDEDFNPVTVNESTNGFTITKVAGKNEYTVVCNTAGSYYMEIQNNSGSIGNCNRFYGSRMTRTVTFNMNGHGSAVDPKYANYNDGDGEAISAPSPEPTATGYTFGGWYKEAGCTNAWNFNTKVTEDMPLYAKWTVNPYTLTLTVNEGISKIYYKINGAATFSYVTSTTNLNVNYNSTYYLYAEATTGYTLNSPYSTYTSSNPYSETKTTSTQSWAPTATINTYTVTIAVNNAEYGSVNNTTVTSVPYGTELSNDGNTVSINGTTVTATPTAATAQYTYAFSSWTNGTATVTGDLTVTANFTITTNNYTVSFNVQGHGSAPEDQSIAYGNKVTKPSDPSATGYTFGGWYKESTCENEWNFNNDTVTGTTILYAKWTARTTTITLNPNGGIAGTTEVTATYDSLMPGIEELPTKTGYNFLGFFDTDEPTGGTKYYNSTGTAAGSWDKDVATSTLYARWVETSYYVEYVGNEPSGTATDLPEDDYWTYDYDSTLGSAPSLAGYTFTGWYSDTACQNRLGDADQLIHNANLSSDGSKAYIYAGWAASECTVTITVNDSRYGSVDKLSISNVPLGSSVTINGNKITIAGTTVTASTKASPDGYNNSFAEWTNAPATITGAVTITATFTQISGETAAIAFATNFNTRVGGICVYAGGTNFNTLKTEWNGTQQTAYNNLEDYQKYWLNKDHASSDDNVQDMFAMYDYIAHKYGTGSGDDKLHDFLNRNNSAQAAAINNFSPFDYFTNDENNLSTLIIVIASSISLLSITALSVLMVKKRKHKVY